MLTRVGVLDQWVVDWRYSTLGGCCRLSQKTCFDT